MLVSGVEGINGEYVLGSGEARRPLSMLILEKRALPFVLEEKSEEKDVRLRKKHKILACFEGRRTSVSG